MNGWRLQHTFADLPALFYTRAEPTPVPAPEFVVFNVPLAETLGLDAKALDSPEGAAIFAGNRLPDGAQPIAQAYAGHQFGHFTTLGDGRAILLGEQLTPDNRRVDIQLKGAGPTRYSRQGDGRAALAPMLRELIISEALHALGIPTTRSLAVVSTGEPVYRERALPGAVLTRMAASHIRVGTFEWAAAHRDTDALRALADYTLHRHYPELAVLEGRYVALLDAIGRRQADLIAQWQLVGFIHGVMNTDNMSIAGETIDYGPCAFMDRYDPATVFSSIDQQGRYAYANQPPIAQWNLGRLAEALLPLFDTDQARGIAMAQDSLARFAERFDQQWLAGMRAKLGLFTEEADDPALIEALMTWMRESRADFTSTFRRLSTDVATTVPADGFTAWHTRWQARLARQPQQAGDVLGLMRRHNPVVIPRNHTVEEALAAAADRGSLAEMQQLLDRLATPFDYTRAGADGGDPPPPGGPAYRTFCGT